MAHYLRPPPPYKRLLSFDPVAERHKIFGYNMVTFVAKECIGRWTPYGYDEYISGAMCPLTYEFKEVTRTILRKREKLYAKAQQDLLNSDTLGRPRMFAEHARQVFRICFDSSPSPGDLLCTMVYVARIGLMFYDHADFETASVAADEIGEAVLLYAKSYGPGFFQSLTDFVNEAAKVKNEDGDTPERIEQLFVF